MKRLIILNPQSRNGTAAKLFDRQRAGWESRLGKFELYHTKAPGDATEKVRRVLRNGAADQILIAGGDGSINEAFRGYWEGDKLISERIPLGIINFGTGGDFFRTVEAASDDYGEALMANRFRGVDAARVTDSDGKERPFLNIASVGMAGEVNRRLKQSKFQKGAAAYFYHTLKTLLAFEPGEADVEWLDRSGDRQSLRVDLLNFFVCNGRFSGGGMQWAPDARLDSGMFQVTLIGGKKKWPLIRHSGKVYSGQIDRFPGAQTFEAREVTVKCSQSVSMETDGEIVETVKKGESLTRFSLREKVFPLVL